MSIKYIIHNVGEYYRPSDYRNPIMTEPWVKEYTELSEMEEPDRLRFQWMLDNDEIITNSGNMVWQIRGKSIL